MKPKKKEKFDGFRDPTEASCPATRSQIRFFTVREVASMLEVSMRTVRRWIAEKELVVHHFGSAVRVAESDLRAFMAMHRVA